MNLTHVRLLTDDVERLLAFYRDVLGLEVTLDASVYFELRSGNAILGLFRRDLMGQMIGAELPPGGSDAAVMTFAVDDVDEAARSLREKGAELVSDPKDYEAAFLRVAHLRDPDGNLIEINAPLKGVS
ncbi:MAG: VOC family protein [Actinomycetota bacterium]|nr:VOC family protein [Actinomycetota bacterium]